MATSNSLASRTPAGAAVQKLSFSDFLNKDVNRRKINEMVGGKNGDRFITAMISAVGTNPALSACDHSTILSAAMLGEALKLSPSPQLGQYYMVPFEDTKNKRTVATFQLGYKGYIQLAIRSGYYKKLNVLAIKEGELVRYDPLNEEFEANVIQDVEAREAAKTIGYYAMFEYQNGFRKILYWPKAKMLSHADKYSAAFSLEAKKGRKPEYDRVSYADFEAGKVPKDKLWLYSSFWYKDFDGMALKTMLRQLISKWGIMSIEMQQAFESDMTYKDEGGRPEYLEPIEPEIMDPSGAIDLAPEAEQEDIPEALPAAEPDWMK